MNELWYIDSLEYHRAMKNEWTRAIHMNESQNHVKDNKLHNNTSRDFIYKRFKNIESKQCII